MASELKTGTKALVLIVGFLVCAAVGISASFAALYAKLWLFKQLGFELP